MVYHYINWCCREYTVVIGHISHTWAVIIDCWNRNDKYEWSVWLKQSQEGIELVFEWFGKDNKGCERYPVWFVNR